MKPTINRSDSEFGEKMIASKIEFTEMLYYLQFILPKKDMDELKQQTGFLGILPATIITLKNSQKSTTI